MNINVNEKLMYLGAGCGIGLVLGLLFAPQSGEETRHDLTDTMDDLTHSVIEKGKNVAQMGRQRFNESVESGKRKYNDFLKGEDHTGL
jgi:gas vesicle protein